jgi:hypothetical protein
MFKPLFIKLVKKQLNYWWPVVVGIASKGKAKVLPRFMPSVDVLYQQGKWNQCFLFKAAASGLRFCSPEHAASHFSTTAPTVQHLPHPNTIQILRDKMIMKYDAPEIAGAVVLNQN